MDVANAAVHTMLTMIYLYRSDCCVLSGPKLNAGGGTVVHYLSKGIVVICLRDSSRYIHDVCSFMVKLDSKECPSPSLGNL